MAQHEGMVKDSAVEARVGVEWKIVGFSQLRDEVKWGEWGMTESNVAGGGREEALYSICLLAAFADGGKADAEREELRRIGESLMAEDFNGAAIYQKVLLGRTTVEAEAGRLDAPEWRQLAYEMAVKVCEADGVTSGAEKEFLAGLADRLGIDRVLTLDRRHFEVARTLSGRALAIVP